MLHFNNIQLIGEKTIPLNWVKWLGVFGVFGVYYIVLSQTQSA